VARLLAAADVFCLPSHFEGLPMSVIEAMLTGLPVVATDIRGPREQVVAGETGLLVPPPPWRLWPRLYPGLLAMGRFAPAWVSQGAPARWNAFMKRRSSGAPWIYWGYRRFNPPWRRHP
jgi:glycosyltransferase involved in cell wall biosynthesis